LADSKQEESFKVVDKRLFNEEGELRQDAVDRERREEEAAAAKIASAPKAPDVQDTSKRVIQTDATPSGTGLVGPDSTTSLDAATTAEEIPPSRGFQMLVDFLTRNAAAMLGGMADPRTGQPYVDIDGAREMIDMLDALREKTRGNLGKVDDELLIEVIGSLKLTFVEMSKAAAAAMAKQATGKK
jgi:Domain of unknown function (DUF1844)